jgi:hypothetical protein
MSLLPKPPPAALAGRKNVETMAFGFGALFVYAMISDPDGGVDLNNVITVSHLPRLWPSTERSGVHRFYLGPRYGAPQIALSGLDTQLYILCLFDVCHCGCSDSSGDLLVVMTRPLRRYHNYHRRVRSR